MLPPTVDPIAEFYTRHPYPPPVDNLDRARDEWRDPVRLRADYHLRWPGKPYRADLKILVAGCGTWQAARYALCQPDAHVVGVDVSPTSIAHTEKLKRQYNLRNLEIRQLPIEQVDTLDCEFDLVVCTGVLHHLEDPDAGLEAFRSVLNRDGAMYLMVYAPYGRTGVYMVQEYCRRLGIGGSEAELHDLIATLEALPPHHPLVQTLRESLDARNPDALADALLNPRDRSYSVPQLFEFIERHGLTFGRWYRQAPYQPQCGAIASTPHAKRLTGLAERDRYAAMELWRGTIAAHSVIVRRRDADDEVNVRFDDERWWRSVPIRLPWTQLIEERLPAGAAGVLLNRSHQHHDLVLAIDAVQKQLFAGIDGQRRVADIAKAISGDRQRVRGFFEKLWYYDQIVLTHRTPSRRAEAQRSFVSKTPNSQFPTPKMSFPRKSVFGRW